MASQTPATFDPWTAAADRLKPKHKAQLLSYTRGDRKLALQDLVSTVKQGQEESLARRWKFTNSKGQLIVIRDLFDKIARWIDRFVQVGDAAVQYDPGHASLPWAAVRFILQLSLNDSHKIQGTAEGVEVVSRMIARYASFEAVYLPSSPGTPSSAQGQFTESLIRLYTNILLFLSEAAGYYELHTAKRIAASIMPDNIQGYLQDIEKSARDVDNLAHDVRTDFLASRMNEINDNTLAAFRRQDAFLESFEKLMVRDSAILLETQDKIDSVAAYVAAAVLPQPVLAPASTVPFQRDDKFVGRERSLDRMETVLQRHDRHGRFAIVGLGGIGKSQVAIEYSYRLREKDPHTWVFWIYASNRARFVQSFEHIASVLDLPGRNEPGSDVLRLVHDWLTDSRNGRWLLIVDNADDTEMFFGRAASHGQAADPKVALNSVPFSEYLPQSTHGAILITSRNQTGSALAGDPGNVEMLRQFDEDDALLLLQKKLLGLPIDEAANKRLVHTLDYIPLAISQAAAYIMENRHRVTVSRYLKTFDESESEQAELLEEGWKDLRRDYSVPNSVITTWRLSFDEISRSNALAADILSMMSVLDRQGILEKLIKPEDVKDRAFDKAMGVLLNYSLVFPEADGTTYAMHRLVQISTRRYLELAGQLENWQAKAVSTLSRTFPLGDFEMWGACEELLPHARVVLDYVAMDDMDGLFLLRYVGYYIRERGDYAGAFELFEREFACRESFLGPEHPVTLNSVNNLAFMLQSQGRDDEAESMHRQVLEVRERVLGEEHHDTLITLINIAAVLQQQGRYDEAEYVSRRGLRGTEKVLGADHSDTLICVENLASALERQGRYEEAEDLSTRALESKERVLGREHPKTLITSDNLSTILRLQGKYEVAEQLNSRALEGSEKLLGKDHPDSLVCLHNRALVLEYKGVYHPAAVIYEQACSGFEKILGPDHPRTLKCNYDYSVWRERYRVGLCK